MTTVFDAPMHDFSGDNTMDADMLPSSTSDTDWLQVESMMEDGDATRPLAEEVDMIHGDVQEFEMRDAGEAELTEDLDQMLPEAAGQHTQAEPQDQEIPDASRAPTPSTQISQHKILPTSVPSDDLSQGSHTEQGCTQEATRSVQQDSTISQSCEGREEPSTQPPAPSEEQTLIPHVGVGEAIVDNHDASTLSGELNRSPHPESQVPLLEPPAHGDAPEPSSDLGLVAPTEPSHEEHSVPEDEEDHRSNVEPAPQLERHIENQVTQEEEDGPLIDPPPSVLLSYPFDGSHFTLFNLPEDPQPGSVATEITATGHDDAQRDLDTKPTLLLAENPAVAQTPILLFRERFALYYEPLSRVFEALRADEAINTGGRFDHNIELVISAPELDLTLPEDNVNAREVSLHDLGVLHTGCDLSGSLSLRLDTISPRFGTRYKAIRDEIVRVVSQQEEDEHRSRLESVDALYTDGALLHESPNDQVQHDAPENFSLSHNHTGLIEHAEENHEPLLESKTGVGENGNQHESDSHHVEAEEDADAEGYEDAESGEYVEYEQYDDETRDGAEEIYEDAEGEYAEEEGEDVEAGYGDAETPYPLEVGEEHQTDVPHETRPFPDEEEHSRSVVPEDATDPETTGEVFDHAYEYTVHSSDKNPSIADASEEHESTPSTQYVPVEESSDPHASTSAVVDDDLTDTPELDNSVNEVTPHDAYLITDAYSDTESLLSQARPRSRYDGPHSSAHGKHGQDEVIAYEDTVEHDDDPPDKVSKQPTLPTTTPGIQGSRAVSTASKRSYDEHEIDQLEGVDSQHNASSETKRLRVD